MADYTRAQLQQKIADLRAQALSATTDDEAQAIIAQIKHFTRRAKAAKGIGVPPGPLEQAQELNPGFREVPHNRYLSDRLADAFHRRAQGENVKLVVSMPPRAGKTQMVSKEFPTWAIRRDPLTKVAMVSYDPAISKGWASHVRQTVEDNPDLGISIAPDGGKKSHWYTEEGGHVFSTSIGGAFTGLGTNLLIIDDPIKNFIDAQSSVRRDEVWDWWSRVAFTRLEHPYIIVVVQTRWHEDDLTGRLLSADYPGDPTEWEQIVLPAIAEGDDVLGRKPGEPLLSPLSPDNDPEVELARWTDIKESVGSYVFSAMYQQNPIPSSGTVFDVSWFRYWTTNPDNVSDDGRVVYVPEEALARATWVDSWDMTFQGTNSSDYVVGQRWARTQANRYLVAQVRGRWSFTQAQRQMEVFSNPHSGILGAKRTHRRLVEAKANGPAIMDALRDVVSGLKGIIPKEGKQERARSVSPEVESGNVFLPYPGDPGMSWVNDLVSEIQSFPNGAHDDQVDAMVQALRELRGHGGGSSTVPSGHSVQRPSSAMAGSAERRPSPFGAGMVPRIPGGRTALTRASYFTRGGFSRW